MTIIRPEDPATEAGVPGPSLDLSPVLVDAFVAHLEHHLFQQWTDAMDAAEATAWEPIRRRLAALRGVPTIAEQDERRRFPLARQLHPTPGWPPIAIPGQPGRYLTLDNDRQGAA
ncbi:hypothetical protein OG535_13265 [Kitasatospora sp. NBC_00085]|uniref:hypothetical protein n=1 Tax=Kitasatospora sp. NBC_00085 TaxID=2903566 RepID=UPI003244EE20